MKKIPKQIELTILKPDRNEKNYCQLDLIRTVNQMIFEEIWVTRHDALFPIPLNLTHNWQ